MKVRTGVATRPLITSLVDCSDSPPNPNKHLRFNMPKRNRTSSDSSSISFSKILQGLKIGHTQSVPPVPVPSAPPSVPPTVRPVKARSAQQPPLAVTYKELLNFTFPPVPTCQAESARTAPYSGKNTARDHLRLAYHDSQLVERLISRFQRLTQEFENEQIPEMARARWANQRAWGNRYTTEDWPRSSLNEPIMAVAEPIVGDIIRRWTKLVPEAKEITIGLQPGKLHHSTVGDDDYRTILYGIIINTLSTESKTDTVFKAHLDELLKDFDTFDSGEQVSARAMFVKVCIFFLSSHDYLKSL